MRLYLFDWNGTLLDDMPACYQAFCKTFTTFGKEPITQDEFYSQHEPETLAAYRAVGITAPKEELMALWSKEYESQIDELQLAPETIETLTTLQERDATLGLISGEQIGRGVRLMKKLGVFKFFRYIQFGANNKSHYIEQVCALGRVPQGECCYLGNVPSDIRFAQKAGVTAIAFITPHFDPRIMMAAKPDKIISQIDQILHV
ncbi:MAG: HAD hydrolase-like protein [Patescibacteria group bacterium]